MDLVTFVDVYCTCVQSVYCKYSVLGNGPQVVTRMEVGKHVVESHMY